MNKEKPLVSIITPSYNQAEFLEDTIRSVLDQGYPRLEYIVVDGGSSDGSVEIIEKFADRIAWWVSEKDNGQSDAINKGMKRANGEIVAWLNSDDVYRPGAVRAAVDALMADPDCGMVYGNLDSIDRDGKLFHTIQYRDFETVDLLAMQIIGQPAVFMRRDALEKAGWLDESYNFLMDHHLWLRIASQNKIQYVPQTWAAARHHSAAKNTALGILFAEEARRILEWARTNPDIKPVIEHERNRIESGQLLFESYYLVEDGQYRNALSLYLQALGKCPSSALGELRRLGRILLGLLGIETGASSRIRQQRKPLLVTGGHRSGATWVGKMLNHSRQFAYISEPLNRFHRTGIFNAKVPHWYQYICEENQEPYLSAFKNTLALKYGLIPEILSLRSPKDIGRMFRDMFVFLKSRLNRKTPLLKDPFALFSVPWFIEQFDCDVVIVVHHPAAYVNNLVRLGWFNIISDLLSQPLLVRDQLLEFQHRLMEEVEKDMDPVARAALFWCVLVDRTAALEEQFPDKVTVWRYEDLAENPVEQFSAIYKKLELPYKERARRKILEASNPKNLSRLEKRKISFNKLENDKNFQSWQNQMAEEEIQKIKEITSEYFPIYYADEDWL